MKPKLLTILLMLYWATVGTAQKQIIPDILVEGRHIPREEAMTEEAYGDKINRSISFLNSTSLEYMTAEEAQKRFNYDALTPTVVNYYNPDKWGGHFGATTIDEMRVFDKKMTLKNGSYGLPRPTLEYTSDQLGPIEIAITQDEHVLSSVVYDKKQQKVNLSSELRRLYLPRDNFKIRITEGEVTLISNPLQQPPSDYAKPHSRLILDLRPHLKTPPTIPTALVNALDEYCRQTTFTHDYPNYRQDYFQFKQQFPEYLYYIRRRFLLEAERNGFQVFFEDSYPGFVAIRRETKKE
ncbi:MAG: hypothetical protein AAF960_25695 [Bacteroidota bacterium]